MAKRAQHANEKVYAVRYENGKTFEMGREILRLMSGRDYPDLDVLHINGDSQNNTRENLAWGDLEPNCSKANFRTSSDVFCIGDTTAVASYTPNGYGLFDMAGNVREWVWGWYYYDFYRRSSARNPGGPDSGQHRVTRGGSWQSSNWVSGAVGSSLRTSYRSQSSPTTFHTDVGFRCARTP